MTVTSWKIFTIAFSVIVLVSTMLLPFWPLSGSSLDIEDMPLYSWGVDDGMYKEDVNAKDEQLLNVDLETDSLISAFPEDGETESDNSKQHVKEDIDPFYEMPVDNSEIESLFESISHPYWKVRLDAINELGLLQDKRSIPVLIERALYDDNRHPRWRSSIILKGLDPSESIVLPRFLAELESDDGLVVRNAAVALALMGDNRGTKELVNGLEDLDFFRRWESVFIIGLVGDEKSALFLSPLLKEHKEPNAQIRMEAAIALGKIGSSDDALNLVEVLRNDTDMRVREAAVNAITKVGNKEVISALERLHITESDAWLRQLIGESIRSLR